MEKDRINHSDNNNSISLQLRSKEVSEIMGNIPDWIGSWGMFLIIILFAISMLFIMNVQCVQKVNGKVMIAWKERPISLHINKDIGIKNIKVANGSFVYEKDTLFGNCTSPSATRPFILSPATGWLFINAGINNNNLKSDSKLFSIVPISNNQSLKVYISKSDLGKIKRWKKISVSLEGENPSFIRINDIEVSSNELKESNMSYVVQVPVNNRTLNNMLMHNPDSMFKSVDCQIIIEISIFIKLFGWLSF